MNRKYPGDSQFSLFIAVEKRLKPGCAICLTRKIHETKR
jgi:hypothetical protein